MSPYRKNNTSIFYLLSLFIIYCLAISSFLPVIRALPSFNYIWPVLVIGWLVCIYFYNPRFFLIVTYHRLLVYILFFYTIFMGFVSGNISLGNRFFEFSQIMIFYWAYELSTANRRIDDLVKLLLWLLPVFLYTIFRTIFAYVTNPNISRTAKKDSSLGLEQMASGIGGYEFIYMLVFIAIPLLYFTFNKSLKYSFFVQVSILLLIAVVTINIVFSNFTIALLIIIVAILCFVFLRKFNSIGYIALFIMLIISVPFTPYFIMFLLDFLINLLDGGLNAQRLQEVKLLLELGVVDLSLEARMHAFKYSILSALAFPNFGLILTSNDKNILLSLGQHSFFLDTFALYGIWVGCLQVFVFLTPLVRLLSDKTKANLTLSFSMLLLSLFFFIVNNVTPSIGFAIFFVYPVLNYYLTKQERSTTYVNNYRNRYRKINI